MCDSLTRSDTDCIQQGQQPHQVVEWEINQCFEDRNGHRNVVYSLLNHLSWRLAREHCAEFGHCEGFKLCEKIKVKVTLVQALRRCTGRTPHRGCRGIALPFHDHGTRRGRGVSITPRLLFTLGKTRYPLYRRLGGPQGRSGQVQKISPPLGFDPWTLNFVILYYVQQIRIYLFVCSTAEISDVIGQSMLIVCVCVCIFIAHLNLQS